MDMQGTGYWSEIDNYIKSNMNAVSIILDAGNQVVCVSSTTSKSPDLVAGSIFSLSRLELAMPAVPWTAHIAQASVGAGTGFSEEIMTSDGKCILVTISGLTMLSTESDDRSVIIKLSDITPLQVSENKFRTLSDVVPQLVWTNDEAGQANYFNARWYEYSGLSFDDSFGLGWQAMVHPDDAGLSISRWHKCISAGEIFDTEYRLRDHAGAYRWHIGRNVPFKNEAGVVKGWYGTATDVHELKTIQSSLRESEEKLRLTMESAIDYAIITTDEVGIIRGWSAGAERIFGYRTGEVVGSKADIIFTERDREAGAPAEEMRQARDEGRASDERWHLRKDGTVFFMSGVTTPIINSKLSGYVKVARDLTSQRADEQRLRNSEERYRIALQAAEMIAWDYDVLADKIVWQNESDIIGIDTSENRLALFMSFVHESDKMRVEKKIREALENTGTFQEEFRIFSPGGGEFRWMSGYGKTMQNEDNQAYRLVGVMYDITKRKALEAQKEDFIGIASHELKTPVTSIKAYAEVLEEMMIEKNDAISAGLIAKLNNQVDRLNNLIKQLLDTTKISEGHMSLQLVRFPINTLVAAQVEELRLLSNQHQFHLKLAFEGDILADPGLIAQVLTNLVSNAIKYSPKGGDIYISTETVENGAKIGVIDSGIGIPDEDKGKVFQRFFRVATPGSRTFPGLGLGLYITSGIIHRHNGSIWVENAAVRGSAFFFILPA